MIFEPKISRLWGTSKAICQVSSHSDHWFPLYQTHIQIYEYSDIHTYAQIHHKLLPMLSM